MQIAFDQGELGMITDPQIPAVGSRHRLAI
jgi:hypothetical protein